jgi:transposase
MKLYISLNHDEIQERIPYPIVAETMSRAVWNTGKRKRLMKQYFTESEIEATYRLHKQAYDWYLRKGVPDEVKMTLHTYELWHKLADFCCML